MSDTLESDCSFTVEDSDHDEIEYMDLGTQENSELNIKSRPCRKNKGPPIQYTDTDNSWTNFEKEQLLRALFENGTDDNKLLASYIPTKTEAEVKEFTLRREKQARTSLKKKGKVQNDEVREASIDKWIQLLSKILQSESFKQMHLARVFKYIALFEKRESDDTNVKLNDCYEILASLLSGNGPKVTNRETSCFLFDTFQNFAKEMKRTDNSAETIFLQSPLRTTVRRSYSKKKEDTSAGLNDKVINPLKIPENVLKK